MKHPSDTPTSDAPANGATSTDHQPIRQSQWCTRHASARQVLHELKAHWRQQSVCSHATAHLAPGNMYAFIIQISARQSSSGAPATVLLAAIRRRKG